MDSVTGKMLCDEVWEVAKWYGFSNTNTIAETFALGYVAATHRLERPDVDALLVHVEERIREETSHRQLQTMVKYAIQGRNN